MKKIITVLGCLALSACAAGIAPSVGPNVSGFWVGLWHGLILPIAFIISLFDSHVGIYDVVNSGWPYNLGFFLGTGGFGTGLFHFISGDD